MPVKIPFDLPAAKVLTDENIFVMDAARAESQDIRPLHIGLLNLMPTKEVTETQLLRLLGNTSIQIEVTLLNMATHECKNTDKSHLDSFYRTFDEVKNEKFDGLIITGAPVEKLDFEQVDYWEELKQIMDWSADNVYCTMHICWAAQAGLYHHFGIGKQHLSAKAFGVFPHKILSPKHPLVRGFDDVFFAPHSRHTTIRREDILVEPRIDLLAESDEAGVLLCASHDGRQVFITGHAEYDAETLDLEYKRDLAKGLPIAMPKHYYPKNDPKCIPQVLWRAHANLLFANWLNYFVYQETPFDLQQIHHSESV